MKKIILIIKELIAFLIVISGMPLFIRHFIAKKKATILLYHNPKKELFDKHLIYLTKKYNVIPLNKLIEAINNKNWNQIPSYPLILTFDDGHRGNYNLFDVCKVHKVNPTIYVCTKIVNSLRGFWFNSVKDSEKDFLKRLSQKKRMEFLKKKYNFFQNKNFLSNKRQALNKYEILKMKKIFDFQSHSRYHAILPTCKNKECFEDIKNSKKDLKKIFKYPFDHFSYPNGDYSSREVIFLKKTKYFSGRTCDIGWNDYSTNPFKLKICLISDNSSLLMLKAQLSGVTGYLRYLTKGSFNGKKRINKL